MKLDEKTITFRVETEQLALIDKYAERMKLNRSQLIRNLLNTGLDDVKLLDKTGILSLALKGRDLLDMVRTSIDEDRYEVKDDKLVIDL